MPKGWTFMFLKSILNSHVSEWARTLDIKIGQKPYFSAIFGNFWPFLGDKICTKAPFNPKIGGFMRIHMLYDCSQIMSHKSFDKN